MRIKSEIINLIIISVIMGTVAGLTIRWQDIVNDRNYNCLQNQMEVIELMRKNPELHPIIPTCYL